LPGQRACDSLEVPPSLPPFTSGADTEAGVDERNKSKSEMKIRIRKRTKSRMKIKIKTGFLGVSPAAWLSTS
jgi:hypothetical protein